MVEEYGFVSFVFFGGEDIYFFKEVDVFGVVEFVNGVVISIDVLYIVFNGFIWLFWIVIVIVENVFVVFG